MTLTARPVGPKASPKRAQAFVEGVLDELEVTERAFHHLNHTLPLIADLVRRARRCAGPGDRVLLIGGSTLIAESLTRLGFQLEVWQFPQAYLTDGAKPLVTRSISVEDLDDLVVGEERYQLIIAPLVIESLHGSAEAFLRKLRSMLDAEGRLLIATANQSRLDTRLSAFLGRPIKPRAEESAVSLSWPALAAVREYHAKELGTIARGAGFHVRESDYVVAERAFLEMEPLNAYDYARRKLRGFAMHSLPTYRDVLVVELGTRVGEGVPLKTRLDEPFVSVFVSVHHGGEMLRDTLRALLHQTYRNDLYEIVVLHDASHHDTHSIVAEFAEQGEVPVRALDLPHADGPESRNLAMAGSRSDISAHTDDACYLPDDWIQAAVSWFDKDTVAVTGPVFLKGGSEGRHLSVPGTRPDPDEKGVCPQNVFPISNVFYRTPIVVAAGGFDRHFSHNGGPPDFGWDTELAWRLQRSGWKARFREEVYQFRLFAGNNARFNWIGSEMRRASELPALIAAAPEYGDKTLAAGAFASKQTMYFDWALAGLALAAARREWPWLLTSVPWLALISHHVDIWPPTRWPSSAKSMGKLTGRQLVWLTGFVRGSIKAKKVVL